MTLDRTKISDPAQLQHAVHALDQWTLTQGQDSIERTFEFKGFPQAIAFINAIAPLAEALDHHPEIFNVYNTVALTLTTHDANGLTAFDFKLAGQIDQVHQDGSF